MDKTEEKHTFSEWLKLAPFTQTRQPEADKMPFSAPPIANEEQRQAAKDKITAFKQGLYKDAYYTRSGGIDI